MKRIVYAFLMLSCVVAIHAQSGDDGFDQVLDEMTGIDEEDVPQWDQWYEELASLAIDRININTATREDLEQLPFLNDRQIEDICEYVYRHAPLRSLGELSMIESLDYNERILLSRFLEIGKTTKDFRPTIRQILKDATNELTMTAKIPFYTREGDKNGYLGYPYRHSIRFTSHNNKHFKAGLIGAQDAGEPFFANRNKMGYDFYSFYLLLKNIGRIKALAAGKYRVKLGMGLILNKGFSIGNTTWLSGNERNGSDIHQHSSLSSSNYMQGMAATVRLSRHIDLTSFLSCRPIDATANADNQSIATILSTGYHRTPTEMSHKHQAFESMIGGSLTYHNKFVSVGYNMLYNTLSKPVKPDKTQPFRKYYPEGKEFVNASISYNYRNAFLSLSGELATNKEWAIASINTLAFRFNSHLELKTLYRFYSYQYTSLHANSYRVNSKTQNENGAMASVNWRIRSGMQLQLMADYSYFPWPKYMVSAPSHSWDSRLSFTCQHRKYRWVVQYRLRNKQRDNQDKTGLVNQIEHKGGASMYLSGSKWTSKSQVSFSYVNAGTKSFGYLLSQSLNYNYKKLSIQAMFNYFHTDDYSTRIYLYERDMQYACSFPTFFGHGIHYALWGRYNLSSSLRVTAKLGVTSYFDRSHISENEQKIDSSSKSDLDLQVSWRF